MTMAKIEKLLLTTDLSEASAAAFPMASLLARQSEASVTVVTVLDLDPQLPPGVIGLSPTREASFRQEARQRVEAHMAEMIATYFDDPSVVARLVLEGHAAAKLVCELARDEDFDMIVTATHGRSGVARMVLGSVAEKIVRHAECAVTLVPAR